MIIKRTIKPAKQNPRNDQLEHRDDGPVRSSNVTAAFQVQQPIKHKSEAPTEKIKWKKVTFDEHSQA